MQEYQIIIIGLVASFLGVVIRLLSAKGGITLSKFWMTIIVAGLSVIMAILFAPPELPTYVDPLQFIGAWLALASGYLGAATAIYNLLLDKLLDKFELTTQRFLKK